MHPIICNESPARIRAVAFRHDRVSREPTSAVSIRITYENIPKNRQLIIERNHGKFRPTLMSLVSSNDPTVAADTVRKALQTYQASGASAAVKKLAELRGIGPATASLLLAVHQPEQVIFFSDEAFYWLCAGGKKTSLKYNAKEYQELIAQAQKLVKRLDVSATDVERVAYVLMRRTTGPEEVKTDAKAGPKTAKRKPEPASAESAPRRSKRSKLRQPRA